MVDIPLNRMSSNPKHTVIISLVACTMLIGGNSLLSREFPSYKQIGGVFGVFLLLSIGVELAPELAAMFALLVLVTVFLATFGSLSTEFQNLLAGKSSKPNVEGKGGGFTNPATAGTGSGGGGFGAG